MRSKKGILFIILLILFYQLLSLISCSSLEHDPPIGIEKDFINQQILLRAPSFSNTFSTIDPINLELKYNTSNEIIFPNNYNLKLFTQVNEGWIEIQEKPTVRLPSGNIIFSPTKDMPAVEDIFVSPELLDISQQYELRIYIIGDMKVDGDVVRVAAYTDVTLHP